MAGVAGNSGKWLEVLEFAGSTEHGWNWLKINGMAQNGWKLLEIAERTGNCEILLEINEIAGNGSDTDDENNSYDVEKLNGMALSQF